MDQRELLAKLAQIEEQAARTLAEFPQTLTKERQRMIIALAKSLRSRLRLPDGQGAAPAGARHALEDVTPLGQA